MSSAIRAAMLTGIASRTTCGIPLIWNINGRSRRKPCGKSAETLVCAHIVGAVMPSFSLVQAMWPEKMRYVSCKTLK